ncbi:MAG: hypothetical protein KDD55_05995 [Bdellovibrionales bacterium]|nr:hypothetical protein [Bdellovibrionales bacterium]
MFIRSSIFISFFLFPLLALAQSLLVEDDNQFIESVVERISPRVTCTKCKKRFRKCKLSKCVEQGYLSLIECPPEIKKDAQCKKKRKRCKKRSGGCSSGGSGGDSGGDSGGGGSDSSGGSGGSDGGSQVKCGGAPSTITPDPNSGSALWNQMCSACHNSGSKNGRTYAQIKQAIQNESDMNPLSALSNQDVADIACYLN